MKSLLQQKHSKVREPTSGRVYSMSQGGFTFPFFSANTHMPLSFFLNANIDHMQEDAQFINIIITSIAKSDLAAALLQEAADYGWTIALDDLDSHDFHLDVPEKHMILNTHGLSPKALKRSDYFMCLLQLSLIRGLRDIWQEKRHGGFEDHYSPQDILMLERVRAADCDTMAILAALELRIAGYDPLWKHIVGSDEGDMAIIMADIMEHDRASTNPQKTLHRALQAAFRQWYVCDDRVNICDHETLEYLDGLIAQSDHGSPFGQRYLSPVRVEVLSCLPDKTAYLQHSGQDILRAPIFAGMQDKINQAHFMQIMHETHSTIVSGVPFRSAELADKIFPLARDQKLIKA